MKLVLLFGFISVLSLLPHGLPPTHDGEYHVVRFYEFDKTLRAGDWYPRWAPDLNYGYGVPLFNYVYPLPNYVASLFHLFGISFIDAFKLNMFFATIIGSAFFYLWAKQFWGKMGGVVSSIFYTFSPYHFVEIYIRGSVGEVWALAFFPAFLWAFTRFIESKQKIFLILSSVFLALIIFSHNILALMFFPLAISYALFCIVITKGKKLFTIYYLLFTILLSLGLSSIFWLPAILESNLVKGLEIFDVTRHFPDLYELLVPSWGSGFSGGDSQDHLSFQIGLANLTAVLLSLLSVIFIFIFRHSGPFGGESFDGELRTVEPLRASNRLSRISHRVWRFWSPHRQLAVRSQNDGNVNVIIFFLVWFFIVFFLMLKISNPIWENIPFMNYFQFPWRLMSIEILFASFLAGSIFTLKLNWMKLPLFLFLIFLSFSLGIGYAKPAHYFYRDDKYYITRSNFIDGTNSPGDVFNTIWFNQSLKKQSERITIDKGRLESSVIKPTDHSYFVSVFSESNATINIAYFPNWTAFINGKKITIRKDANGLISFVVPKGKHLIEVKFQDTLVRTVANFVFLASIFFILFYSTISLLKNYEKK